MTGKFVVVEGLEGAGKSSAISVCRSFFESRGIEVTFTREPGGTPMAEALRSAVKETWEERVLPETELFLMYAARAQLVENVIKPALQEGKWVVADRHDWSTQAYQGGGRQIDPDKIVAIKDIALKDFKPDHVIYLDVTPDIGLARARGRGALDRIELEDLSFFERTRNRYLELVNETQFAELVDATKNIDEVQNDIKNLLESWFIQ